MNEINKSAESWMMNHLFVYMEDSRLNIWHLAILTAVLSLGYRQGAKRRIKVSRRKIMALSHINTIPTYHKYFKQLQCFGYVKYIPSYHPGIRSVVQLSKKGLSQQM
ncbi:hypothetical protein [Flavobacterium anhuiense]|uniref:hypothetical protein n=1 Tax=Flavobacterium anhuiense TaxID=459526 RepID=UPI003D968848